jgi:hypothetical protein
MKLKIVTYSVVFIIITTGAFCIYINSNYFLSNYPSSQLRNIIEFIYFISAPLLFIVSIIALKQINIAKIDLLNRNERETITLTANLCEKFADLIEDFDKLTNEIKTKKGGDDLLNKLFTTDIKPNKKLLCHNYLTSNENIYKEAISFIKNNNLIGDFNHILNQMEWLSIYFVKGVADEEIAYDSIGSTYCRIVIVLLSNIILFRCEGCGKCNHNKKNNYYGNTLHLFETWKARIDSDKLTHQINLLNNEKSLLFNKRNSIHKIKPNV